jgi:lipopolysaccharide transport system permease protein
VDSTSLNDGRRGGREIPLTEGSFKNESMKTYLRPPEGWAALEIGEVWRYHEVIYLLTWRDIKVRYKQAALGLTWVILQPLLVMVILSVVFGHLARLPSDGVPYPLFTLSGILPWQLFHTGVQRASISLIGNSNLLTRVYFPRLSIPLATVLSSILDFFFAFLVFLGLMVFFGYYPTWKFLGVPLLIVLTSLTALGVGLWLSALNVQYRDVQHAVPFILQAWMFASPVAYSAQMVPQGVWQVFYGLNPMVGVIQGFRWALLGGPPPGAALGLSVSAMLILLISGMFYFKRMERSFADII